MKKSMSRKSGGAAAAASVAWPVSLCAAAAIGLPSTVSAFSIEMPEPAVLTAEHYEIASSIALPIGRFDGFAVPSETVEGDVSVQAWRIDMPHLSTLELVTVLRAQIEREGYTVLFECETDICGGFDFRFGTDVMAPPEMYVDLGDFRYLTAENFDTSQRVAVLVSQSRVSSFAQISRVGPAMMATELTGSTKNIDDTVSGFETLDFAVEFESIGRYVLSDLSFERGSASLVSGDYASLAALADYLTANPEITVALVGHTDSDGSLETNIVLSRERANAALTRLINDFGIAPARLEAQGMGYLSPIATNLTAEGRELNRRVEVILTTP